MDRKLVIAFCEAFEKVLPFMVWESAPLPAEAPPDAHGYVGRAPGWIATVVDFPQGAGRGYDGTAAITGSGQVWHLLRPQALAACTLATINGPEHRQAAEAVVRLLAASRGEAADVARVRHELLSALNTLPTPTLTKIADFTDALESMLGTEAYPWNRA